MDKRFGVCETREEESEKDVDGGNVITIGVLSERRAPSQGKG